MIYFKTVYIHIYLHKPYSVPPPFEQKKIIYSCGNHKTLLMIVIKMKIRFTHTHTHKDLIDK